MTARIQQEQQTRPDEFRDEVHVRGIASDVILDKKHGLAIKMYRRRGIIEALYRIAFQAKFPYVDNRAALKAAQYRRKVAGLVTLYFLGQDVVTPVVAVERVDGRWRFVTELVKGGEPKDHDKAREFLHEVTAAFIQSGLPTWQVTPHNPRSLGNLMETEDGEYRIIDLESNVVTPMVPLSRVWTSAREAHLPPFDDIDLLKLWKFIDDNWDDLQVKLGKKDANALVTASAKYAFYERLWHENEPRVWSRTLRAITRVIDLPGHLRWIGHKISGWSDNSDAAAGWLQTGIDRWEAEGRLTQAQAQHASHDLENTQTLAVLAHLGAHLAMSIPLRFPLGSMARFAWTLTFRAKAELRALTHHHADEETRRARAVHSLPVMFAGAIPGVGAAAYVLAAPLRNNRILMAVAADQALRLLPLRLYDRLHASALTGSFAKEPEHTDTSPTAAARDFVATGTRELKAKAAALLPFGAAAVVLAGAWGYLAYTGNHDVVGEFGVVASAKVAMSIATAIAGHVYFRSFWKRSNEAGAGAPATLFWMAAGVGAAWVAVDDYLSIHEAVVEVIPDPSIINFILDNVDKVVVAIYMGVAIIALRLFWAPINVRPGAALLAVVALVFGAAALGFDAFALSGTDWAALEETFHLLAVTAIFSAILVNQLELRGRALR
jgi:hypothetical protein